MKVASNKGFRKFRRNMNMNFQKRFQGERKYINCGLDWIMTADLDNIEQPVVFPFYDHGQIGDSRF